MPGRGIGGRRFRLIGAALFWSALTGCFPDSESIPATDLLVNPVHFPAPVYGFKANIPTPAGFELGRRLFYDPILSKNGTVACGSCHQQSAAFADPDRTFSLGINHKSGIRNTPSLANLRWSPGFFWDGGANHLEVVSLAPITNPDEMDENLSNVVRKLNLDAAYAKSFRAVFNQDSINSQQLLRALAQFTGQLVSAGSPYDQYVQGQTQALSFMQVKGLQVFRARCAGCHPPGLFTDHSFRNNGLDAEYTRDAGRAAVTLLPVDAGKFKVPSLRNVTRTAPYMHDGRFQTLGQVLEHYTSGVKPSATLDAALTGPEPGIALTTEEKAQLLTFLESLTDQKFITDPRLANPF